MTLKLALGIAFSEFPHCKFRNPPNAQKTIFFAFVMTHCTTFSFETQHDSLPRVS